MKMGRVQYDHGVVVPPSASMLKLKRTTPGGRPSIEAGFYHRFKISGTSKKDVHAKLTTFMNFMARVEGYDLIQAQDYQVSLAGLPMLGVDLIYVVEEPAGGRAPETTRQMIDRLLGI